MKNIILAALLLACAGTTQAQVGIEDFVSPPVVYKPVPLWFWNNTQIDEEVSIGQFRDMINKDGYGGCAILPFGPDFKPEYLSPAYFSVYGKVIEEARRQKVQMSLYDEYGFPSGSMGAINGNDTPRFMNKYPEATVKRLDKIEYTATPETEFRQAIPEGKLMSVVAMDTLTKQCISLTPYIQKEQLSWRVPTGAWKVLFFVCVKDGDPNVDYLDPEAVKLFVKETHEVYYQQFPSAFGTVITETFFDEPTMYRAAGRMWTDRFNEKFESHHGFSPELLYPALWYNIGEDTPSARNYLFGFRAKLYSEGFMKTIQEWAAAHGILSTGHQDQEEVVNPVSVSGDLMLCGKYMDIPGIDKIGGNRPAELYYKVISSSAYNWDKQLVMSETYGDMGNLSMQKMYTIAMEQYVKGINNLIPHAVWYNDKRVTFLPELSHRNPLYRDSLPEFNQFLTRLNYLLRREGRHVADIAMLYPIESLQGDHYLDGKEGFYKGGVIIPDADYVAVSALLTDSLGRDFTYLHPEVLNEKCEIKDKSLHLDNIVNKETFRVLVVPGMRTISLSNLQKIEAFYKAGGYVLFTTLLPSYSAEAGQNNKVKEIISGMLSSKENTAGGKVMFVQNPSVASLRSALAAYSFVSDVSFPAGNELNYIHKVCNNQSIYYLANLKDCPHQGEVTLKGHIVPLLLNPHTGEKQVAKHKHRTQSGSKVTSVTLSMSPNSSVFIVQEKEGYAYSAFTK